MLDRLVSDVLKKKNIYGAVFCLSRGGSPVDQVSAAGEIDENSPYYIASINKLFISALVLKLHSDGKLDKDDTISKYLPVDTVQGLHVLNGVDSSNAVTITHLLSHTSGLPCYLVDKQINGKTAMRELESGIDQAWPIDKVIREVKKMRPHFAPGEQGKARYADTNHHLLCLVIEKVTGDPVNVALRNLFNELNLTKTHVCGETDDQDFVPVRHASEVIHLPIFLASTKYDIVSTARDQMAFLKAFFNGHFFPKEKLFGFMKWNSIFFPFKYGVGIQRFKIPRILSPFQSVPEMIGHCGSTGSVAFYVPEMDVYITGTTNQQARPNVAFQTMIRIIHKMKWSTKK
jgi:CubicO group peptidase (beta-lactamase class C family)